MIFCRCQLLVFLLMFLLPFWVLVFRSFFQLFYPPIYPEFLFRLFLLLIFPFLSSTVKSQECDRISVRKEWRTLQDAEKRAYLEAVVALQGDSDPDGSSGTSWFAKTHNDLGQSGIHWGALFLPWHRQFTREYELQLQEINPDVAQHYWDASLDSQDYWAAPVFKGGDLGFGGLGQEPSGCVKDGPFTKFVPYKYECLKRATKRGAKVSPPSVVNSLLSNYTTFYKFAKEFEVGFHAEVHVGAGGIMLKSFTSPNEPLFFMHHSNVDRIWGLWQEKHKADDYGGDGTWPQLESLDSKLLGFEDVTVANVIDYRKMCYSYDQEVQESSAKSNPTTLMRRDLVVTASSFNIGEVVKLGYPIEIPRSWIDLHNMDERFVRKCEHGRRQIIDRLNALPGYLSPSCIAKKADMLKERVLAAKGSANITCSVRGKKVTIPMGRSVQETVKKVQQVVSRIEQKVEKPTVARLASIIGEPSIKSLRNPFSACKVY